jgi:hypothetical protein
MSFEEEFSVLWKQYRQKQDENDKARDEAFRLEGMKGLDSEFDVIFKNNIREYNRRLVLLKVKYGKELDEGDKELYNRVKNQA